MQGRLTPIELLHVLLIGVCCGAVHFSWVVAPSLALFLGTYATVAPLLIMAVAVGLCVGVTDGYTAPPQPRMDFPLVIGMACVALCGVCLLVPFLVPGFSRVFNFTIEMLCSCTGVGFLSYGYIRRVFVYRADRVARPLALGSRLAGIALLVVMGFSFALSWTVLSMTGQAVLAESGLSGLFYYLALAECAAITGFFVNGVPRWGFDAPACALAVLCGSVVSACAFDAFGSALSFQQGLILAGLFCCAAAVYAVLLHVGADAETDAVTDGVTDVATDGEPSLDEEGMRGAVGTALDGFGLTEREQTIVRRALAGETSSQIAEAMGIQASTVRSYLQRAYKKVGVSSLVELRAWGEDKAEEKAEDKSGPSCEAAAEVPAGDGEPLKGAVKGALENVVERALPDAFPVAGSTRFFMRAHGKPVLLALLLLVVYIAYGSPILASLLPGRPLFIGGMAGSCAAALMLSCLYCAQPPGGRGGDRDGKARLAQVAQATHAAQVTQATQEHVRLMLSRSGLLAVACAVIVLVACAGFSGVATMDATAPGDGPALQEPARAAVTLIGSMLLGYGVCMCLIAGVLPAEPLTPEPSAQACAPSDAAHDPHGSPPHLARAARMLVGYMCLGMLWGDAWFGDLDGLNILFRIIALIGLFLLLFWAAQRLFGPRWDRGYINVAIAIVFFETVIEYMNPLASMHGVGLVFCLAGGLAYVGACERDGASTRGVNRFSVIASVLGISTGGLAYEALTLVTGVDYDALSMPGDYASWGAMSMLLWLAVLAYSGVVLYGHLSWVVDTGYLLDAAGAHAGAASAAALGSGPGEGNAAGDTPSSRVKHYLLGLGLTERDAAVLELIYQGLSGATIAKTLYLSLGSVNAARMSGYRHLGIHRRKELIDLIHTMHEVPGKSRSQDNHKG